MVEKPNTYAETTAVYGDHRIANLERQIAELLAELRTAADSREFWKKAAEEENAKLEALAAENAWLRALPLKDEVERVVDDAQTWISENVRPDDAVGNEVLCEIRALLSRLRAGEQEGWRLPEGTLAVHGKDVVIAYDDFRDARRAFSILENVIGAAPSEQGCDRG